MRLKLTLGPLGFLAPFVLPLGLFTSGTLSAIVTPLRSSLLLTALAWGLVAVYLGVKIGFRSVVKDAKSRKICLFAGLMFALGRVCERIAADRVGIWRANVSAIAFSWRQAALTLGSRAYCQLSLTASCAVHLMRCTRDIWISKSCMWLMSKTMGRLGCF
jgi:hypothetical protein